VPSLTLLGQAVVSGLAIGGLYGLLGLGLTLSWGLLRQINLAYFALAFLAAYLSYSLASRLPLDPLVTLLVIGPLFFALGVAVQALLARAAVTELTSLLVTFGLTVIIESLIQWVWTADFRRLESVYGTASLRVGPLFIPVAELLAFLAATALAGLAWAWLRFTWVGKALRASAEDAPIAAAFGVNHRRLGLLLGGVAAATAGVAGTFVALVYTLAPAQIYAWIGVVFAVVILGVLGNPWGPLLAGMAIGVSEALTMALTAPAWAPLVSFGLLIVVLLLRPGRA
jgi:branched-chain amino acid transport system permease protein